MDIPQRMVQIKVRANEPNKCTHPKVENMTKIAHNVNSLLPPYGKNSSNWTY